MSMTTDMKNLSEEIISLYKQRIKENEELVIEVQEILDGFRKDHQEMAAALRTGLDKDEKTRLKEFVPFMESIKREIDDLLAKFDKEHLEMSVELRKNLSDGEVERIKEYNEVIKNIKKTVTGLLSDFSQERGQAAAEWNKMQDVMAQLRKTGLFTPSKEVIRKAEKKEVKKEIPVKAEPKKESEPEMAMTLEEKVLDYINKRPKGVKISEMEELLGETRMKLGYVSKKLLEDDKVLKVENVYYPKPKIKE